MDADEKYAFENWLELNGIGNAIEEGMKTVSAGFVEIGGVPSHVGEFKVATGLVSTSLWNVVMGGDKSEVVDPVVNVSYLDVFRFLKRINTVKKTPGRFSIPTEAQFELALKRGITGSSHGTGEMLCTVFGETNALEGEHHHFYSCIPMSLDGSIAARFGQERHKMSLSEGDEAIGFRLVLVGMKDVMDEDEFKELLKHFG